MVAWYETCVILKKKKSCNITLPPELQKSLTKGRILADLGRVRATMAPIKLPFPSLPFSRHLQSSQFCSERILLSPYLWFLFYLTLILNFLNKPCSPSKNHGWTELEGTLQAHLAPFPVPRQDLLLHHSWCLSNFSVRDQMMEFPQPLPHAPSAFM